MDNDKKIQASIDLETYEVLKVYCAMTDKKIGKVAGRAIKDFLSKELEVEDMFGELDAS